MQPSMLINLIYVYTGKSIYVDFCPVFTLLNQVYADLQLAHVQFLKINLLHKVCLSGLNLGWVIRIIQINQVMFCPDQVGLTRFIKYLTWIMHWIKYVNNGDELSMLGGDDGCVSPNFPWKNQLTVQSKYCHRLVLG